MIIIVIVIIIFLVFLVSAIPQAFRNKFGPEWIPAELKISFNHFKVDCEDNKTIKYLFSDEEISNVFSQIDFQISNKIQTNNNSFPLKFQESYWCKIDNEMYEYRQLESNNLKATLSIITKELVYYK